MQEKLEKDFPDIEMWGTLLFMSGLLNTTKPNRFWIRTWIFDTCLQLRMQNCSGEKPRQILQQTFIFLDVYLGMRFWNVFFKAGGK